MTPDDHASAGRPMRGAARVLHDILDDMKSAQTTSFEEADNSAMDDETPKAQLGDLIDRLDERAFGLMLLLLALPCCLPFIYLLPQIVALPMLALAGQMAAGRPHPWLPGSLHEREFSVTAFQGVVVRSEKYLSWIERFARPRLGAVTSNAGARIVGALLLIPTASILVPLPSTNTVPGIGVAITSLGLIERDGVLVILGLLIGFLWVALLLLLGAEAVEIIKNWLSARP
ncbi:MAG: exopolysaccharide biosynthesis protein [Pseudomonadota bacterium]